MGEEELIEFELVAYDDLMFEYRVAAFASHAAESVEDIENAALGLMEEA